MFDTLPYFDLLLNDLGIRRWRKTGAWGWLGEVVVPFGPSGYGSPVGEWKMAIELREARGIGSGECKGKVE